MKKETLLKRSFSYLLIIIVSVIVGFLLLILAYSCPDRPIIKNASLSTDSIIYRYTTEDRVWMNWPDYFTDLVMVNIASYNGSGDGALYRAASNDQCGTQPFAVVKWLDGQYPYEYKTYHSYSEGDPSEEPMPYGKYWNGYLVFLRPLLCFFTYDGIYFGTYRLLAVMLVLSVILMLFRNRVFVVPFTLAFLTLRPFSKFCLTYAVMEILLLVFLDIAVLDKRIHTPGKTRSVFFVLMGVVSVYFTLLQFSFIIPLFTALYLVFSDQQMLLRGFSALKRMFCDIFEYAVGFCAMWAGKWVILAVFAPDGVSYLLQSIKLRSSSNDGGEIITLKDVLLWNGCGFYYKNRALIWSAAVLAVAVLITVVLLIMVRRKDSSAKFVTVGEALTVVAALFSVLIRYILLMNHSRVHYFFMNRLMSAVVLAILALVFMIMTRIAYALSGKQRKTE